MSTTTQRDDQLIDALRKERDILSESIKTTQALVDARPVIGGAEITLGLRALQLARMWLGTAEAMNKGMNPWVSNIPDPANLKPQEESQS